MKQLYYYISDEFISKVVNKISDRTYLIAILFFGMLIRGRQYLTNRSFWLDEAFLANNFKDRSFMQLLEPLDYSQVAPIGFLWSEKLMSNVFGVNELALRFIPFLSSIIAIYLLYDLGRILLSKKWGLIMAFAFTLPINITYFSSELKQYMTDLSLTLFLFWFFYRFVFQKPGSKGIILIGALGAVSVWFSNITPIILMSIGAGMWISLIRNFSKGKMMITLVSNLMWLASFYLYYVNFISDNPLRAGKVSYWSSAFLPHQLNEAKNWMMFTMSDLFKSTASHYEMTYLAMGLFVIGTASVIVRKSKRHYIYLILPIIIHLALSFLKLYPFSGRLVLYLVPLLIIFEMVGIEFISGFFKTRKFVVLILSTGLLALSFLRVPNYFVHPIIREDIKPVLEYVKEHKKQDDIVYVYYGAHAAFKFYRDKYFTKEDHCIVGVASSDHYDKFIKEFSGLKNRVWMVFSHMNPPDGIEYLDSEIPNYQQLDYFEAEGAKVYLINKI